MWGERNCLSFETAVAGIEPPSSRLTVRRSTTRPPLPTYLCMYRTVFVSVSLILKEHEYLELTEKRRQLVFSWWLYQR